MTDNRYAPPVALVSEIADKPLPARPRPVAWAIRLLWASTALSVLPSVAEILQTPTAAHLLFGLLSQAVAIAFACYLYVCVGRGRNWARIVLLVLVALNTAVVALVPAARSGSTFEQVFMLLNTACDIASMALLFTPAASAWFRKRVD
jgi:hypothetical protein